jgi:large subunit ribosomal protein L19
MTHPIIQEFEAARQKKASAIPDFRPGDSVRVAVRITEGEKERIQEFEGVVIRRKGTGMRETFNVRRVSFNIGMERIFPLHSPRIESITVIRRGSVRRAKLHYLRALSGKKARIREARTAVGVPLAVVEADRARAAAKVEAKEKAAVAAQAAEAQAAAATVEASATETETQA